MDHREREMKRQGFGEGCTMRGFLENLKSYIALTGWAV
jgi:hypothetical protein